MKTKLAIVLVIMAVFFVNVSFAEMENPGDAKTPFGYLTTDMWFFGVNVYSLTTLDHVVLPGLMTQAQVRALAADPQCTFLYYSDGYDVALFGSLVIVVYYRYGNTANIICLGDIVF